MIEKYLSDSDAEIYPVFNNIGYNSLYNIDLSGENKELEDVDIDNPIELGKYIDKKLQNKNKKVAFGGYLEDRLIYKRSKHFETGEKARTIHLGVDIWLDALTGVCSPLDAVVHSYNYNNNYGDYGATIILEHNINNNKFHTLYGHLSIESLEKISESQKIKAGEKFASLGNANENGNWPSHLHFQIIEDMQDNIGDYPGVCAKEDVEFYSKNCPNPLLLLKF